jgi:hypothetical protein
MMKRKRVAAEACCIFAIIGCGGGKPAESPTTCPQGTALQGSDCLPTASAEGPTTPTSASTSTSGELHDASQHAAAHDAEPSTPSDSQPPYDKDAVEAQLKRGARSVKANCGAATDEDGQANGPWGDTKASVTLGRNGHVKQVTVPAPFSGTPAGG